MLFHLMIVDDEPTLRKGLSNFIDWSSIDCIVDSTASNGKEAIALLEERQPDIIISDIRMPECDGISLAKFIYQNYPRIKVILLTGYADFEYARSAVEYQVTDFILKPTSKEKLLNAVKKAQTMVLETKNKTSIDISELSFLQEQLFQEYTEEKDHSNMVGKEAAYGIALSGFYMMALQLSGKEKHSSYADLKSIIFAQSVNGYVYSYSGLLVWIYTCESVAVTQEEMQNTAQELTDILETLHTLCISVGVSSFHQGLGEIAEAFLEAFSALNRNFYHNTSVMVYQENQKEEQGKVLDSAYAKYLYDIENLMQNWEYDTALSHSNLLFQNLRRNFINAITVKNVSAQIYFTCCKILLNKDAEALSVSYLEEIEKCTTIQQLEIITEKMMNQVQNNLIHYGKNLSDMVRSTICYIHENLADNLSLDTISSSIPVNPTYLSRIFKKEYGEGIADYINGVRIQKAKALLETENALAYEIAKEVGFHDPSYFSATFKKYTGYSPSEYKNRHFRKSDGETASKYEI